MLSYLSSTSFQPLLHSILAHSHQNNTLLATLEKHNVFILHSPGFIFHFMTSRMVGIPFRSFISFIQQMHQGHCSSETREVVASKLTKFAVTPQKEKKECPVRLVCMALYGSCGTVAVLRISHHLCQRDPGLVFNLVVPICCLDVREGWSLQRGEDWRTVCSCQKSTASSVQHSKKLTIQTLDTIWQLNRPHPCSRSAVNRTAKSSCVKQHIHRFCTAQTFNLK